MITSVALRQFFGTPKGLLIIILAILTALAAPGEGIRLVAPGLAGAVVAAGLIDVLVLRKKRRKWEFPDGAVLTGLFVAMVLSPHQPWWIAASTSALAIVSKWVFRSRWANVFNPAAFGIVATFYLFDTGQSWWGALPEIAPAALVVLFVTGGFIANRVNKMPLVLVFLGVYFLLFTITSFGGDPGRVAEIFRAPDLHAVLFFAFFILTDPPTSPVKYPDQLICGLIVAVSSYAIFELLGAAHYLLSGVLVGNVWETWHRWRHHRDTKSGGPIQFVGARPSLCLCVSVVTDVTSPAAICKGRKTIFSPNRHPLRLIRKGMRSSSPERRGVSPGNKRGTSEKWRSPSRLRDNKMMKGDAMALEAFGSGTLSTSLTDVHLYQTVADVLKTQTFFASKAQL